MKDSHAPCDPCDRPQACVPAGLNRRAFVRAVAGAAAAGAIGTALAGPASFVIPPALPEPDGASRDATLVVRYAGAKRVHGPAPRGLPLVPLDLDPDGVFSVRETEWKAFAYCGRESAPGLQTQWGGDNVLRYWESSEEPALGARSWWSDRVGAPVRVSDFEEAPEREQAVFTFRSEGQSGHNILIGALFRIDHAHLQFESDSARELAQEALQVPGFIAYHAACTHFCCTVRFKMPGTEQYAQSAGQWENLFCSCHSSGFDPKQIAEYRGAYWPPRTQGERP